MKKLTKKQEKVLERTNEEEYQKYYTYMRNIYEQSIISNFSHETRKKLYPILKKILKIMNRLNNNSINLIGDKRNETQKPKIYAVTHIGKCDIEMISEVIGEHTYILSGDFENLHSTTDGLFLEVNGIIYLNEKNKEDRKRSRTTMEEILKNGGNILYFPEGTWNLTHSTPVMELFPGIIDIAINAEAEIIPVGIEQYRKPRRGSNFIANIGKNINPIELQKNGMSKTDIKELLRDAMATLKWEIYESIPQTTKDEFNNNYYSNFIQQKMNEWPGFTYEEVQEKRYINKEITTYEEAFEHLEHLIPSKENAFLLRKKR